MNFRKWGPYVFLIGFLIAILIGIVGNSLDADNYAMLLGVLVILGLVVGIINISEEEAIPFLIATIALLQSQGALGALEKVDLPVVTEAIPVVASIITSLLVFVLPAALVVALITIYNLAGEGAIENMSKNVMRPVVGKKK